MARIVIIGNGISGVTAARHIRKRSDDEILIVSSESEHFFSRTALMYIYMGHMKFENTKPYEDSFWKKNRIDLKQAYITEVDFDNQSLKTENGDHIEYDKLILATGSKPNKFGWKGQDLQGVQGLYSLQDLELLERNTIGIQNAVIVGGGLIGVELAEMLLSRNIGVTFLVREKRFWGSVLPKEEGNLVSRHIKAHHVDLRFETELDEVVGENGKVVGIKTKSGELIDCQLVGLTVGVHPNIEFLKNSKLESNRGILVNEYLETNIPNVYAIGDCAEFHTHPTGRRNIEQVWYTGKMMGETVAQTICDQRTSYKPGVWFNSAKFFDIEYQTYGWVWSEPKANESTLYWEDQSGTRCIKLVYDKETQNLLGANLFGVRGRHLVFDNWIKSGSKINQVLNEFDKALFDPEFYFNYMKTAAIAMKLQLP